MAITLGQSKISLNLATAVDSAITAVKKVRGTESARKESEFQKAVAGGMSYAAQLKFRQDQLDLESKSDFQDPDFVSSLETSIANTKKLARFETIRNKYKDSLDSYVQGKESIQQHLDILQNLADTESDPDMLGQIRDLISTSRQDQATNQLNALKNRALVAQKDTSQKLIDDSISEITNRRTSASISQNDDEVAMWDDTLNSLKSAKAKLQIENGLNEITFQSNTRNLNSNDKIGILNNYVSGADAAIPITYNGVTYPSLKAYWENKRGDYISSNFLSDVQKEMQSETDKISASNAFGQVPVARIQAVDTFYKNLVARPEFAPFATQIEQQRTSDVNKLVTNLADSIYNEADATGNQDKAQKAVQSLETAFNIAVARQPFSSETSAGKSIATTTIKDVTTPPTPAVATPAGTGSSYTATGGDTLSRIAAQNGVSLATLLQTPGNEKYKTNPNLLKPNDVIALPSKSTPTPSTPVVTPPAQTTPSAIVTPPVAPTVTPPVVTPPVVTSPVVTPTPPVTATPKSVTIASGDTLQAIAQRELGDPNRWKELRSSTGQSYDETSAKKLQLGTKIIIPI